MDSKFIDKVNKIYFNTESNDPRKFRKLYNSMKDLPQLMLTETNSLFKKLFI